jgi:HK97 family phage major capsid protein
MENEEKNTVDENAQEPEVTTTTDNPELDQIEELVKGIPDAITKAVRVEVLKRLSQVDKSLANISVTEPGDLETKGFKSFGEFVQTSIKFFTNREMDSRLKALFNESVGEDGGMLVPTAYSTMLLNDAMEQSQLWSLARDIPIETNSVDMPTISNYDESSGSYYGGLKGRWIAEGQAGTEEQAKFDLVNLKIKDFMILCPITNDLLEDSPISIEPIVRTLMSNALALGLDDVFINGTGVGQPVGLINGACKLSQTAEDGQTAATITTENVLNMRSRLLTEAVGGSYWMINPDCFTQIMKLVLAVGTGGVPLFTFNMANAPQGALLGRPIIWTDYCQTLGTEGDIILTNPNYYLKANKSADMKASDEVYFSYNKRLIRLIYRCDGQPWMSKAKTYRYSSTTRSPIITLATRS